MQGSGTQFLRNLSDLRLCKRCNGVFRESDNLGRWKCSKYHPLGYVATVHQHTYDCCGKKIGSGGCVRADHTDRPLAHANEEVHLSREDAALIDVEKLVQQHSWIATRGGGYVIKRVDEEGLWRAQWLGRGEPGFDALRERNLGQTEIY